jgi:hypothetical protein
MKYNPSPTIAAAIPAASAVTGLVFFGPRSVFKMGLGTRSLARNRADLACPLDTTNTSPDNPFQPDPTARTRRLMSSKSFVVADVLTSSKSAAA